jgi:hypothetical protein
MYSHSPKPPATRSQPSANSARTVLPRWSADIPVRLGRSPTTEADRNVSAPYRNNFFAACDEFRRLQCSTLRCPLPRAIQSPKISFPVRFGSVWFGLVRFGSVWSLRRPPSPQSGKISFFVHRCPRMSTDVHGNAFPGLSPDPSNSAKFHFWCGLVRFGAVWCTPAFSAGPAFSSRADSPAPIGLKPGSV